MQDVENPMNSPVVASNNGAGDRTPGAGGNMTWCPGTGERNSVHFEINDEDSLDGKRAISQDPEIDKILNVKGRRV